MNDKLNKLTDYLEHQEIAANEVRVLPSFFDPDNEIVGSTVDWLPMSKQAEASRDLTGTSAESMSLASMTAVHMLGVSGGMKILDVCSAPGMKGLYLNKCYDCLEYCANDLSGDRLSRLSRLFEKHDEKPSNITKYDARFIDRAYPTEHFDRILLDAPCSGEGVIMGGNAKLLAAWSPAKVKRLQQLQISILKSSWKLLAPGGRLIYATCTLNKNENERVVKKALGITLDMREGPLETMSEPSLKHAQGWRILPSKNSIGFFIAALDKSEDDSN